MNHPYAKRSNRLGFTMTELLMVMMILSLLSAMAAVAYERASSNAKMQRTEAIIRKIDSLIMERWDGYRTRALPMRIPGTMPIRGDSYTDANLNGHYDGGETITRDTNIGGNYVGMYNYGSAEIRLLAIRQLQRLEMPDRISDISYGASGVGYGAYGGNIPTSNPALRRTYLDLFRLATNQVGVAEASLNWSVWSTQFEGAECLYLQIATMRDGDKSALEWFGATEVGDVDNDGMKEILDGWGNPISFLRWAPGYTPNNPSGNQVITTQSRDSVLNPDPFDPLKVDGRYSQAENAADPFWPFALRPLIFSSGPDKLFDINSGSIVYATLANPNDPYFRDRSVAPIGDYIGTPMDANGDGTLNYSDNITSHDLKGN